MMTVAQLIRRLSEMDPEANVFIGDEADTWNSGAQDVKRLYEANSWTPGAVLITSDDAPYYE